MGVPSTPVDDAEGLLSSEESDIDVYRKILKISETWIFPGMTQTTSPPLRLLANIVVTRTRSYRGTVYQQLGGQRRGFALVTRRKKEKVRYFCEIQQHN